MSKKKKKNFVQNNGELKIDISNKTFLKALVFFNINRKIILYTILTIFLVITSFFIIRNFIPNQNGEISDNNSLNNPDRININIDKQLFLPNEIKIKQNRFYELTFKKTAQSNCTGLFSRDLDIRIDLQESEKTVPIRINPKGEYILECYGDTNNMKIIVS